MAIFSWFRWKTAPFGKDETGATAVEFAMLAAPFLAFLYLLIAMGYMYLVSTTLEDATQQAGRQIRIGSVSSSNLSKADFKTALCSAVSVPSETCLSDIIVDVTSDPDISNLDTSAPTTNGALDRSLEQYDPGDASDYVIVKAYLPMSAFNGIFALLDGGDTPYFTVSSVMVFRSEPFD